MSEIYTFNTDGTGYFTITNETGTGLASGSPIYISNVAEHQTKAGTAILMKYGKRQLHPQLFFKFIKSKIKKRNIANVTKRLGHIQSLMKNFEEMGQDAPYETLMGELIFLTRHAEASAEGFDKIIDESDILKFKDSVEVADTKVIHLKELTYFPRPIPEKNRKIIKKAKDLKLFDTFKILYIDYTSEKLQTNKDKIIQKDPIVFGIFSEDPKKYFYITDWVDDLCDLTLHKLVDKLDSEKRPILLTESKIDNDFIARVKKEYLDKKERLAKTGVSNYKELAKDEEILRLNKELAKKSFWKRFKFWK